MPLILSLSVRVDSLAANDRSPSNFHSKVGTKASSMLRDLLNISVTRSPVDPVASRLMLMSSSQRSSRIWREVKSFRASLRVKVSQPLIFMPLSIQSPACFDPGKLNNIVIGMSHDQHLQRFNPNQATTTAIMRKLGGVASILKR